MSQTTTSQDSMVQTPPSQEIQEDTNGKSLSIVTTFPPLYAHTANLIDDNDTITNLVPPGTSVHFRQPKPSDIIAMESADIIITNGLWLEEFLEDYLDTLADAWVVIVDTSEWIETIEFEHNDEEDWHEDHHEEDNHDEEEHHEEHEDEDHHEVENSHTGEHDDHDEHHHHHEGPDPHIWLDTDNVTIQSATITQALIDLDPSQEAVYTDTLNTYQTSIQLLDEEIQAMREGKEIAPFVVFHDAYQYFLKAYDLADAQVGLVQEFHGDNPSQQEIAELIETIETQWVQTIFTEPQFNPTIVQRLTTETWVTAKEIDPIGTELSKTWYITMMQTLAGAFVQ